MRIAPEGLREIVLATLVLTAAAWTAALIHWTLIIPFAACWIWVLSFFRDPARQGAFEPGQMCAPADGTVTEITALDEHNEIGGPAIRIGIFLSIFNVHINRSPCDGVVSSTRYKPGRFLDARHPDSGKLNESNTLLIDPDQPHVGPVMVRQVSGLIARRIICHAGSGTRLFRGERFGLIKFGSRTELIVPRVAGTDIAVKVGDKVRAGVTLMLSQPADSFFKGGPDAPESRHSTGAAPQGAQAAT